MEKTKSDLDIQKTKLDIDKAQSQMNDDKARSDASSEVSKLARASVIDSLGRIGRKDLASKVTPNMSVKQVEDIFGQNNLSNMVTQFEAMQARKEIAASRVEEHKIARQEKMDKNDTTRLDQASKLISSDLARNNTAFGRNANIVRSADAIQALAAGKKPDQLTNQQLMEIAKNLDAMLSSGAATVSGTAKLLPNGWGSKASTVSEFFTNDPQGARQGGYVKMALDTVKRERELAKKKLGETSGALLSSYMDLAKKHPESWNTMMQMHGLNPDDIGNMKPTQPAMPTLNVDKDALAAEIKRRGM